MLKSIRLKDFAIFKDVTVPFGEHLCVISGETGAGKSIMVDGMLALLGARADPGMVRDGAPEAVIEGLFEAGANAAVQAFLSGHGLEVSQELAIRRIITTQGKSRAYINGSASTLAMLSALSRLLVDIHGQHEHQSLLDDATHIRLLDAYAGLQGEAFGVRTLYAELGRTADLHDELRRRVAGAGREEELLRFQLSEIRSANLGSDEDIDLEKEYRILSNAHRLAEDLSAVYEIIEGDGHGAVAGILRSLKLLSGLQAFDPSLKQYADRLGSVSVELKDIASDINAYLARIDLDAERLGRTELRMGLIDGLKKKYGGTLREVIASTESIERQLVGLAGAAEELDGLRHRKTELERQLFDGADRLSKARKGIAGELGRKVVGELKTLGMGDAVFEVRMTTPEAKDAMEIDGRPIGADGMDRLSFYFSANPGIPAKPLTEIVSGGELSRTMLAIKRVLVKASPVPVLVFDEIDTGIGGPTAEIVGRKLKELSAYHQVICITHLHQIAGFGDYHIYVSKRAFRGRTEVDVRVLDEKERVDEIARMLSGETVTELGRRQAMEYLRYAREIK